MTVREKVSRRRTLADPAVNYAAEAATLGGMMIDVEQIGPVVKLLRSEDFHEPRYRAVFEAITEMYAAGETRGDTVDPVLLENRIHRNGKYTYKIGEATHSLINGTPNALRAMEYAQVVLENALTRQKRDIGLQLVQGDLSAEDAQHTLGRLQARRSGLVDPLDAWVPAVQSLSALMAKELPPVRWAVDDVIGEGVTLLAAKPKKGKTVLMLQIALCIANGKPALGGKAATPQGEALYLALEENERRMQRRVRKLLGSDEPVPAGVHLVYEWLPFDRGGIVALDRWLDNHPQTRLIVIDTLERVRPTRRATGSIYAEDYSAVKDIQRFASLRQVAIVLIHHTGKRGYEDPLDEVSGSTGLTGGVDNILVMRSSSGIMELHRLGRDYTDNSAIALRGDPETLLWTWEGEAEEVRRSNARQAILDALRDGPAEGMTPQEIADVLDKKSGAIRYVLHKMMRSDDGCIGKVNGKYVVTANGANDANAGATKRYKPRKQGNSVHEARVSGTLGTANANADANGHNSLEFRDGNDSISGVSGVSVAEPCRVTQGRHIYAVERTADGRRVCVECREPECHSLGA